MAVTTLHFPAERMYVEVEHSSESAKYYGGRDMLKLYTIDGVLINWDVAHEGQNINDLAALMVAESV